MFREFHHQARGRGHLLDGTRGQDRAGYLSRGGVQAMCLADGVGSDPHSEHGAEALVNEGCRVLADELANQMTFVTSRDAVFRMRLSRGSLDGISGFVLMSDGTANSLYNWRTKELAPACAKADQLAEREN